MAEFDALRPLIMKAPDIEQWLLDRDPRAIDSYRDLAPEEYARSFTAAKTAGADVIDDLYFGIVDNIARGGTEQDFSRLVVPILKQKGWLGGDDGRIATRVALIYDTNLRLARAAGRWTRYRTTARTFPYLRAFTVGDERVRHPPKSPHSDHRAWDGIILPIEHEFWSTYWFPLGFRCRCTAVQMTRSDLARRKDGITSEADLADRVARLGPPVFASPGAGIGRQLADMVAESNRAPMPGRPPINPDQAEQAGRNLWSQILLGQALSDVTAALAKLFGE